MNTQTETINYHQLKQAKSLGELLSYIPELYFERVLFFLLGFFTLSPIIMVALLNVSITFFNPYYLLLQMGYVGIVISGLLFYKREYKKKNSEKAKLNQWLWQHSSYLCLAGVLVCGVLSTLFSSDTNLSFYGDYYRKEGLLTMGAYAGIFMTAVGIRSEKLKKLLIQTFVLASFMLGVVVLLQWLGLPIKSVVYQFGINDEVDFVLWSGIFHNINHYGYYLSMAVIAAGGLFVFEKRKIMTVLYTLAFGLLTWVLVENNTFGAYLGVCAGLFLFLGVSIYRKDRIRKTLVLVIVFIGISFIVNGLMGQVKLNFIVLAGDLKNIVQVSEATVGASVKNESLESPADKVAETNKAEINKESAMALAKQAGSGRWMLWMGAIEIIKDHPLLGTGPDNLAVFYEKMGISWDRPHNEFLQIGASLGIPAMILYMSALGFGFVGVFRKLKKMSAAGIIAFAIVGSYLVSAMFGNTMYYTYPYFLIFLALAFADIPYHMGEGSHATNQRLSVPADRE